MKIDSQRPPLDLLGAAFWLTFIGGWAMALVALAAHLVGARRLAGVALDVAVMTIGLSMAVLVFGFGYAIWEDGQRKGNQGE